MTINFYQKVEDRMNPLKFLLWPFSIVYSGITHLRNLLYDWGLVKSTRFELPIIGVGNLRVGGTGKTPMIEYLIRLLGTEFRICTISRGYGRKSSGFILATTRDNARTIGDEPYQLLLKFKENVAVAVGEDRVLAIPEVLSQLPDTQILLLDDVYQHRSVRPGLSILLTEYTRPFYVDRPLPMGRLRESRPGAQRAHVVVVTKCQPLLDRSEMDSIQNRIQPYISKNVPVFFSQIEYLKPEQFGGEQIEPDKFLLVAGISNNQPIEDFLLQHGTLSGSIKYSDHHHYTALDIERIVGRWKSQESKSSAILTTEKDMVRMISSELTAVWKDIPRFYLPIRMKFLEEGEGFDGMVRKAIEHAIK